jgi:hypothetical protein
LANGRWLIGPFVRPDRTRDRLQAVNRHRKRFAGRVQPDEVWNTPGEAMHIRMQ